MTPSLRVVPAPPAELLPVFAALYGAAAEDMAWLMHRSCSLGLPAPRTVAPASGEHWEAEDFAAAMTALAALRDGRGFSDRLPALKPAGFLWTVVGLAGLVGLVVTAAVLSACATGGSYVQSDPYGNPTQQQNRTGKGALIGTAIGVAAGLLTADSQKLILTDRGRLLADAVDAAGIARITLNRPKAINALDVSMMDAVPAVLDAWRSDESVRAVALVGAALDGARPRHQRAVGEARQRARRRPCRRPVRASGGDPRRWN